MSLFKVRDFSDAVGVKVGTLKVHINRGKLEKDNNGYINVTTELNRRYIKDQTGGKGLFKIETEDVEQSDGSLKKTPTYKDERSPEQKKRDSELDDIELRKKKAALNLSERSAELKLLEIQKKAGQLLPIDLAAKIMTINLQSVFRTFEGEAENVAGIFSEVLGGSRADLAEIIKRMRESLAVAIDKAKEDSAAEIKQAISEYSEVRSRGERK